MKKPITRKQIRRAENRERNTLAALFAGIVLSACYGDRVLNMLGLEGTNIGGITVDATSICVTLAFTPFVWAAHLILKEVSSRQN